MRVNTRQKIDTVPFERHYTVEFIQGHNWLAFHKTVWTRKLPLLADYYPECSKGGEMQTITSWLGAMWSLVWLVNYVGMSEYFSPSTNLQTSVLSTRMSLNCHSILQTHLHIRIIYTMLRFRDIRVVTVTERRALPTQPSLFVPLQKELLA